MPRPRTKLQVSTFPFLAVLLCTMGSLLLFLFIMDRRAKIVAQNKMRAAVETMTARRQETQAERDARQAEWEQAKEKLRRLLLDQQKSLTADAKALEQSLLDAERLLEIAQARFLELQPKLGNEAAKVSIMQNQIARERDTIKNADRRELASKVERTKATLELAELTVALQELKSRKSNEKEVHSLVPYRGKQGDKRTPIYVECVRGGVVFQPDGKELSGVNLHVGSLRSEVAHRAGPLVLEKSAKDRSRLAPEEKKGPYVLFLVRPDGIGSYYQAQAYLRGFELDYGYELVDEDWVLDIDGKRSDPSAGMSRLAQNVPIPRPPAPLPVLPPSGMPDPPQAIGANGSGGTPGVVVPAMPGGQDGGGGFPAGPYGGNPSGIPGKPGPGDGFPGSPSGGVSSIPGKPGPGNGFPGSPPGGVSGVPGKSGVGNGFPSAPNGGTPGKPGSGNATPPTTGGFPGNGGAPAPAPIRSSGAEAPSVAQPTPAPGEPAFVPVMRAPPRGGIGSLPPKLGQPGVIASSSGTPQPAGVPNTGGAPGSAPGGDGQGASDTASQGSSSGGGAQEKPNGPLDPIINRGPVQPTFGASGPKKAPPAVPASRPSGNKDFVITVDCYDDHVTIFPSGVQYRWKGASTRDVDQAVVQTIAKLIERRQASARDGEPPYRPLIRFQVSPEGLRTYLHVYPILEPLRVPMTRVNVED